RFLDAVEHTLRFFFEPIDEFRDERHRRQPKLARRTNQLDRRTSVVVAVVVRTVRLSALDVAAFTDEKRPAVAPAPVAQFSRSPLALARGLITVIQHVTPIRLVDRIRYPHFNAQAESVQLVLDRL